MAAAPKKKKTSQPAKKNTRTPPPPAPTYGREIAGFSIAYEKEALEGESLSIRTAALPEENGCSTVWMTGEHGRGRCFTANLRLRRTGDAG